jgi:hypothetical protein
VFLVPLFLPKNARRTRRSLTREIEWNIEMIADIRDTIQHWLVDRYKIFDKLEFCP